MSRKLLTLFLAAAVALSVYAGLSISEVEGYPTVIATAVGVFGGFMLLLSGLIDGGTAQKGVLAAIASVLPRFLNWSCQSHSRATGVALLAAVLASMAFWAGPLGVTTISIACDEAEEVFIDGAHRKLCPAALNISLWRAPWRRFGEDPVTLACSAVRNGRQETWPGDLAGNRCGNRPLEVQYIRNGIELPPHITATAGTSVESARIFEAHGTLRGLLSGIPARDKTDNLLFATWNLRNFGNGGVRHFSAQPKTDEALIYIAEILTHFDLIAVQEIYDEAELVKLTSLMGPDYAQSLGAPSPGRCGGSPEGLGERLGFIYDRRKLQILSGSSTVVVDAAQSKKMIREHPDWAEAIQDFQEQPCRPPFLARFQLDGLTFSAFTLHAYFGAMSGDKLLRRLADVYRVMNYFANYAENRLENETLLFGGDINAIRTDGPVQQVAEALGFDFLGPEYQLPTNASGTLAYDRIGGLFPPGSRLAASDHGTVDFFSVVMRDDQRLDYRPYFADILRKRAEEGRSISNEKTFYKFWRSYQISDHRPKWVEFVILQETAN